MPEFMNSKINENNLKKLLTRYAKSPIIFILTERETEKEGTPRLGKQRKHKKQKPLTKTGTPDISTTS